MNRGTLINVQSLTFSYPNKTILHDLTFSVGRGETWAIIGKNGSGKSTLVKCIGKLEDVPKGTIHLFGKPIESYSPRERARIISYVPQANGRNVPPYIVYDYVMMGRFPYQRIWTSPSIKDRQIVLEALKLTDTEDLLSRMMPTLSGGELQRVFLAGAVAQRTEILLLDEPATFLDPFHQEMVSATLQRIHDEFGTTVVTITHDINVACSRYSHILALVDGKLFFAGTRGAFLSECPRALELIFSLSFENAHIPSSNRRILVPGVLS
jgi:iron complex transport system ATP-binding protein